MNKNKKIRLDKARITKLENAEKIHGGIRMVTSRTCPPTSQKIAPLEK